MKNLLIKTGQALLLPVIVYVIFLVVCFERFSNLNCIYTIFLQSIIPTITAYAVAFGNICGIFDFTIGSRLIISGLIGGIASTQFGMAGLIIGTLATSLIIATITGLCNWFCRVPSLVLTMGLTMIYEIVGKNIAGRFSFVSIDYQYAALGSAPHIIVVLLIAIAFFYFIANHTQFSYHMRAVGSNEGVARNAGIKTNWVKCLSFIISGLFIAISAILTISQSGSMGAQVNLGSATLLFKPLMGVLIALVLQPLCTLTIGILISQLTLNTIFIGLIAAGLPDTFQNVVLGVFLLAVMIISNNIETCRSRLKKPHRTAVTPA